MGDQSRCSYAGLKSNSTNLGPQPNMDSQNLSGGISQNLSWKSPSGDPSSYNAGSGGFFIDPNGEYPKGAVPDETSGADSLESPSYGTSDELSRGSPTNHNRAHNRDA